MESPARTAVAGRSESPSGAPASMTQHRRWFEGLDGIRFIAAFLIIVHHAGFSSGYTFGNELTGGFIARMDVGVSIFFVLSGFLLYRPYVRAQFAGTAAPETGIFLIRRIVRIYPAYWAALTIQLLIGTVVVGGVGALLSSYLLTNVYVFDYVLVGMAHTWSLATELGFYLLLPFLALAARRVVRGSGAPRSVNHQAVGLLGVCAALALASLAFRVASARLLPRSDGGIGLATHLWTPAFLDVFGAGMALAVVSVWADHHRLVRSATERAAGRVWLWWSIALGTFWFMSTQLDLDRGLEYSSVSREAVRQFLYTVIGVCAVAPVVFAVPRSTFGLRLLVTRPMAYLGLVSYGIYLWHQAVIVWSHDVFGWPELDGNLLVIVVFTTVVSTAIAAVSYHFLENPVSERVTALLRRRRT